MTSIRRLASLALAAAALLAAAPALADPNAGVKVSSKEGAGKYLADSKGMALYTFKKDSAGKSACAGDCLAKWPAFAGSGADLDGLKTADFGTIARADGAPQTTYKGMPLYYFAADKAAGDTKGQGVKEVWYLAVP
jgi:predicted lipoprotein with Yx(FWY)xxD motif